MTHMNSSSSNGIDFFMLTRTLWKGRRTIFSTVALCMAAGVLIALLSPNEYTAVTKMLPQKSSVKDKLGGLSGLASLAGINLNMNDEAELNPAVYPQIISSIPFQLELMQSPLNFSDSPHPVTVYDYYSEIRKPNPFLKYTIGLPQVILKAIRGKTGEHDTTAVRGPIRLTEDQKTVRDELEKLIAIEYHDKDGYVTLSCQMPEALPAAQLAQRTQELLQHYITRFKIEKARAYLEFLEGRHDEALHHYNQAQAGLAAFRDRNRNMATATAKSETERLANNYNLAFAIYSELAKQLEQARIQVKEETPVFTIIQPVSVPLEKSGPGRVMIVLSWMLAGAILAIGILFCRRYF
ncbi:MAG: Wzz/FepE/Etk N-terminal domain-containing protein, partial [Mangrovibacterium sp.]|nr:Wzz/FepE/Etk N-terminal domain-containing protein [Mangrovibacterium sp.]